MSQEPKKVDRRSFLYIGLGAVALIAIGAAAYIAMNPPVVTQTTTVPTTSVVTTTVPTTSVVTKTVPTTTTPSEKKLTIWWATEYVAAEQLTIMKLIDEYQKTHPDIKVIVEYYSGPDLHTKLMVSSATSPPAVPDLAFNIVPMTSGVMAYKGLLRDVTDIIKPRENEILPQCLEVAKAYNGVTKKRSYYVVPTTVICLYLHIWKNLIKEAGLPYPPPIEYNAFHQTIIKAQEYYKGKYAFAYSMSDNNSDGEDNFEQYLLLHGGRLVDGDTLLADRPENKRAMAETLSEGAEWFKKGYIPPGSIKGGGSWNNDAFISQQCIVCNGNPTMSVPAYFYENDREAYFVKTATLPWPLGKDGKDAPQFIEARAFTIFKDGPNPEAAVDFIEWLIGDYDRYMSWLKGMYGRYLPMYKKSLEDPFYVNGQTPPKHLLAQYPDLKDEHVPNTALYLSKKPGIVVSHQQSPVFARAWSEYLVGKMWTRVCVENWKPEDAVEEYVSRIKQLWKEEYG
jgi:ABC-type glycerol-3-phosphate transport system substrate-binding protein